VLGGLLFGLTQESGQEGSRRIHVPVAHVQPLAAQLSRIWIRMRLIIPPNTMGI
jgi:hypothetical protein